MKAPTNLEMTNLEIEKAPTNLEIELEAGLDSVPIARHRVVRWLRSQQIQGEITDEIALVVTELVTNAIEASPDSTARIEVEVELADNQIVLSVRDEGKGFAMISPAPSLARSFDARGRGLPIVNALMDGLAVRRAGDLTEVEVTRNVPLNRL